MSLKNACAGVRTKKVFEVKLRPVRRRFCLIFHAFRVILRGFTRRLLTSCCGSDEA